MCKYQFLDGSYCQEQDEPGSEYCILHMDLPNGKNSEEWKRIDELKQRRFLEKVEDRDYNFEGAKFGYLQYSGKFHQDVIFSGVNFSGHTDFSGAEFSGYANFGDAKFFGYADFSSAEFFRDADFRDAQFFKEAGFSSVEFSGYAFFSSAKFLGDAYFSNAEFSKKADFEETIFKVFFSLKKSIIKYSFELKINTEENLKICLNNTIFNSDLILTLPELDDISIIEMIATTVEGNLIFTEKHLNCNFKIENLSVLGEIKDADEIHFTNTSSEENYCRALRIYYEQRGRIHDADECYFWEMTARRKLKKEKSQDNKLSIPSRMKNFLVYWIEWPLQHLFFYGIYPVRTFCYWLIYIAFFAVLYWTLNTNNYPVFNATDWTDYPFFSLTNAITPGYGGINLYPGLGKIIACIEAIIGTLFLASFVAIFARKYMRS